jgi:hypothetical protein
VISSGSPCLGIRFRGVRVFGASDEDLVGRGMEEILLKGEGSQPPSRDPSRGGRVKEVVDGARDQAC